MEIVTIELHDEMEQIWVQISVNNFKFNIAAVYGPVESRTSTKEVNNWYYELEKSYAENDMKPTMIIGDFNAHVGNDDQGITGNSSNIDCGGEALRIIIDPEKILENPGSMNLVNKKEKNILKKKIIYGLQNQSVKKANV